VGRRVIGKTRNSGEGLRDVRKRLREDIEAVTTTDKIYIPLLMSKLEIGTWIHDSSCTNVRVSKEMARYVSVFAHVMRRIRRGTVTLGEITEPEAAVSHNQSEPLKKHFSDSAWTIGPAT
jgi:hypothetical protein